MTAQALVTQFQTSWEACKSEFLRHGKCVADIRAKEKAARELPDAEIYYSVLYDYKFNVYDELRSVAHAMTCCLIRLAEDTHSGEAGRLSIPREDYLNNHVGSNEQRVQLENTKAFNFNPTALWNQLQQDYGAGKGEEEGYRQAAKEIISSFWFYEGDQLKVKAGYYTFDMRMSLDSLDQKYGTNRYCYNSTEHFRKSIAPLEVFLRWAGEHQAAMDFRNVTSELQSYYTQVISRNKFQICPQMALITFHSRIEWRLGLDLGQKFQIFLGLYGIPLKRRDYAY